MRFSLSTFALLFVAGTAAAEASVPAVNPRAPAARRNARLTNAERFAQGLGPATPAGFAKREVGSRERSLPRAGTRVGSAKRATASCTTIAGEVAAYDAITNELVGYVADTLDPYEGVVQLITTAVAGDDTNLQVHSSACGASTLVEITFWNLAGSYPFLSGTNANDYNANPSTYLSDTSTDLVYIAASQSTVAGATPQDVDNSVTDTSGVAELAETTIFSVLADGTIVPTWVNSDGTSPTTTTFVFDYGTGLYLTGDVTDSLAEGYETIILRIVA